MLYNYIKSYFIYYIFNTNFKSTFKSNKFINNNTYHTHYNKKQIIKKHKYYLNKSKHLKSYHS